eukprot:g266.t1
MSQKMRLFLLINLLLFTSSVCSERMTLAAGCYWSVELVYQRIPGVLSTSVGFCGGEEEHPIYPARNTNHAESVDLTFDPSIVSYTGLLDVFWEIHDPFSKDCQGQDCGTTYRSALFYYSEEQRLQIIESRKRYEAKTGKGPIVTEVSDGNEFTFWPAHEEHQKYLQKLGQDARKNSIEPIQCYGNSGPIKHMSKKESFLRLLTDENEL